MGSSFNLQEWVVNSLKSANWVTNGSEADHWQFDLDASESETYIGTEAPVQLTTEELLSRENFHKEMYTQLIDLDVIPVSLEQTRQEHFTTVRHLTKNGYNPYSEGAFDRSEFTGAPKYFDELCGFLHLSQPTALYLDEYSYSGNYHIHAPVITDNGQTMWSRICDGPSGGGLFDEDLVKIEPTFENVYHHVPEENFCGNCAKYLPWAECYYNLRMHSSSR